MLLAKFPALINASEVCFPICCLLWGKSQSLYSRILSEGRFRICLLLQDSSLLKLQ